MSIKTKKRTRKALPAVLLEVHPNVMIATEFNGRELFRHLTNSTDERAGRYSVKEFVSHHRAAFKARHRQVTVHEFDASGNPVVPY